jgi:hypothetical protein
MPRRTRSTPEAMETIHPGAKRDEYGIIHRRIERMGRQAEAEGCRPLSSNELAMLLLHSRNLTL